MIAVITGDIVNSRAETAGRWQVLLKKALNHYGKEPRSWELYRGDSFQLRLAPDLALHAALHIKSSLRQLAGLDVRMAIGLGGIETDAKKVTEATGDAFIRSGNSFDNIGRQLLVLETGNDSLNETLNLMISLALLTMNNWSETVATVITTSIENAGKNQSELAALLNRTQSSISEALKRGGYDEVKKLNEYYQTRIKNL